MKRSIMAMVIAVFFGVTGLVVLQHSEYAPVMAANNSASNEVIYSINCPAFHELVAPQEVNFVVDAVHNPTTGLLSPLLSSVGISGGIASEVSLSVSSEAEMDSDLSGANIAIEFIHPTMVGGVMCLGTGVNHTELLAQATGQPGDFPSMKGYNSNSFSDAFDSGTTITSGAQAQIIASSVLDDDERSYTYGLSTSKPGNYLSASILGNLSIDGPLYQSQTVLWTNEVVIP